MPLIFKCPLIICTFYRFFGTEVFHGLLQTSSLFREPLAGLSEGPDLDLGSAL